MNVHLRAFYVQSGRHQHAHMISDGRATPPLVNRSVDNVLFKVKPTLHQALLQVTDVMSLCCIHGLLYIPDK